MTTPKPTPEVEAIAALMPCGHGADFDGEVVDYQRKPCDHEDCVAIRQDRAEQIQALVEQARKEEREACAKLADYKGYFSKAQVWCLGADELMEMIAAAIRQRGEGRASDVSAEAPDDSRTKAGR